VPFCLVWAADGAVTGLLVVMTVLVVANAAIGAVGSYVLQRTAESVVLAARRSLVSPRTTTLLREVTTHSLVGGVTGVLTLLATVVTMGLMDLVLLGVTLVALALAGVVIGLVVPRIHQSGPSSPGVGGRDGCRAGADVRRHPDGQSVWRRGPRGRAGLAAQIAFIAVLSVGGLDGGRRDIPGSGDGGWLEVSIRSRACEHWPEP
jgi:ATP-binding cassette subfamily C protein